MTDLYVVRHCQATGNVDHIFQGTIDCDITPCGEKQLNFLAQRFASIAFDAIYTSPLRRARLTAEAINRTLRLPIQTDDELREIFGGAIEAMSFTEIYERYPDVEAVWNEKPHLFAPEGGESMRAVYDRAGRALRRIVSENRDKTVVLASHGALIRNLLCYASGYPVERLQEIPWSDNTAVSLLRFDDALRCEIVYHNDASHLPPEYNPARVRIRAVTAKEGTA